jgi:hypothetical protein
MDELNIGYHDRRSRRLLGDELPPQEVARILHLHAVTVVGAVQDEFARTVETSQRLTSAAAREYILYGVGRRMSMILFALRSLLGTVPPERETPLDVDEGRAVTRDINVVYLNTVGVIDNLAWACFHEKAAELVEALSATQIGLFTRAITRAESLQPLVARLEEYRPWFEELRRRRDPAAHRIPLYLPPSLLNESQVAEHGRLGEQASEAIRRHDWEGWGDILSQQQRLGRFYPVFMHSPNEPLYRFYPTIPEDVGQMIKIIRATGEFLQ